MNTVATQNVQIIGGNDYWDSYAQYLAVREIIKFYEQGNFSIISLSPSYSHFNDEWRTQEPFTCPIFHFTLSSSKQLRFIHQRLFHSDKFRLKTDVENKYIPKDSTILLWIPRT